MRNTYPDPYKSLREEDWWWPEQLPGDQEPDEPLLSNEQRRRFLEDGFIVVDGLWLVEMIEKAAAETRATSGAESYCAEFV